MKENLTFKYLSEKQKKNVSPKRPKYIKMYFLCSFTGQQIGGFYSPYSPVDMLKGRYRKWYNNFKQNLPLLRIYREEGMLVGKVNLHIEWFY